VDRTRGETAIAHHLLTPGYEPSIDELLNDPVAEAIMRYDRITREDVNRVIGRAIVRRAITRNSTFETDDPSMRGRRPGRSSARSRFPEGLDSPEDVEQLA